jgi:hypothetical protein
MARWALKTIPGLPSSEFHGVPDAAMLISPPPTLGIEGGDEVGRKVYSTVARARLFQTPEKIGAPDLSPGRRPRDC